MRNKIKVLTTSPSIDINNNVSGISNLTNLWIKNNDHVNYVLFTAGKKDKTNHNVFWLLFQSLVIFKYFIKLIANKINIVHINMPLEKLAIIRDFFFIIISKLFQKPVILHIRGGFYNMNKKVPNFIRYLISYSLNKENKIIVLGNKERDFLISEYNISKENISVLPNSVKIPMEYPNKELNKKLEILFLGRLDKNKGLIEIIKSLKQLSSEINFKLEIAGDGPDKEWFLKECASNFPNNFNYNGVVFGIQKENLLAKCHIFLLPSYFEGLPNALLEAMSYSLVPIVTPVGSIPDVILNNENGIIIPIKNSDSITVALKKIKKEPLFYDSLSKKANQTIQENFSLTNYLISLNKLYSHLILKSNY